MQTFQEKQQKLQAAIEGLYVAFSSYKPWRQLAKEDAAKADLILFDEMTLGGNGREFKQILPLVLKTTTQRRFLFVDANLFAFKLNQAEWKTWPQDEQNAVQNFLIAVWNYGLAGGETGDRTESWIDAISQVVEDATPFMQMWENEYSIEACETLRDFIDNFYSWRRAPQVENWLRRDELLQRFEQRFFDSENEGQADICAQIVDALTNFRYIAQVRKNHEPSNPN